MSIGEKVAIVISILALSISLSTFYYQFFYVKREFNATIFNSLIWQDKITSTIILNNNGNKSQTVSSMTLFVSATSPKKAQLEFATKIIEITDGSFSLPFESIYVKLIDENIGISSYSSEYKRYQEKGEIDTICIVLEIAIISDNNIGYVNSTNLGEVYFISGEISTINEFGYQIIDLFKGRKLKIGENYLWR